MGLIKDLAAIPDAIWIVGYEGGVVSELATTGMREPYWENGRLTIQAENWHFHLKPELATDAQFVEKPELGSDLSRFVRLAGPDKRSPARIYIKTPDVFADVRGRWEGKEGVKVVKQKR